MFSSKFSESQSFSRSRRGGGTLEEKERTCAREKRKWIRNGIPSRGVGGMSCSLYKPYPPRTRAPWDREGKSTVKIQDEEVCESIK
jgi:hypothetical protein